MRLWLCAIVVNRRLSTRSKHLHRDERCEQTECTVCSVQNVWWKKSESGVTRAKCHSTEVSQYPLLLEIGQTIKTCMHSVWGWMNELRVACEVWSTEVCEVSLTKTLRGKPAKIRLGKSWERFSVATCAPVGWASSWYWRTGNHGPK